MIDVTCTSISSEYEQIIDLSWNWQYKDIYRKMKNYQHHTYILKANFYLSVYNVQFKLVSSNK